MNYRALPQTAFLPLELERLQSLIEQIKKTGQTAPPDCFVTEKIQVRNGKTYRYSYLIYQEGDRQKSHSLGRPNSANAKEWRERIRRRNQIDEVSQQIELLIALIDRQKNNPVHCS